MARPARRAPVHSLDATAWWLPNTRPGRWGMARDTVACSLRHPHRSTEACAALIDAWEGLLVSEGEGVSPRGVPARQPCLAHRMRPARGWAARPQLDRAACGAWALTAWHR